MNGTIANGVSLLEVDKLVVAYRLPSGRPFGLARRFNAVDGVNLCVNRGEAVGLVGETGCGKSSLSRAICGLTPISSGSVKFKGIELDSLGGSERKNIRKDIQMIFQDPGGSLNPRMRVGSLVAEPLEIHGVGNSHSRRKKVLSILEAVGLTVEDASRFPHEFSGGQRQRIAIARAVATEPTLILADEPVSALDVSLQAQILNLIRSLHRRLGLAMLFVSHDLHVVRHMCNRVAVMYLGKIVECGPTRDVLDSPAHPYTRELVASSPVPDPARPIRLLSDMAEPPDPSAPPEGCRYHPRCPHATALCSSSAPTSENFHVTRDVACHHAEQICGQEGVST